MTLSTLTTLAVAGYRSLRDVAIGLGRPTVVTGANGTGKSNLYRALRLLADIGHGRLIGSLASEGGLPSTLWAGPERFSRAMQQGEAPVQGTVRRDVVSLKLGFGSDDFGYAVDLGLPIGGDTAFALDPMIKRECLWAGPVLRPAALLVDRAGAAVRLRSPTGDWDTATDGIAPYDSVITAAVDPQAAPELVLLRERLRQWRFYDQLRSDRDAPARQPRVGTRTLALADDGGDLAAAIQTIREIGDPGELDHALDDAFPGATVTVDVTEGRFHLRFRQPGLLRPLAAAELSDGTLRYLLWTAALLSPRPPSLLVLNEPETSLHPDLLPALGRRIVAASGRTQVVVVTHAPRLVAALDESTGSRRVVLQKRLGETRCVDDDTADAEAAERPAWRWPQR